MTKRVTAVAVLAMAVVAGCAAGRVVREALRPAPIATAVALHAVSSTPRVNATDAGKPKPVNHCEGNTAPQLVLVNISTQHIWMCDRARGVYDSPVTTGKAGPDTGTPTGDYTIQAPSTDTTLALDTGEHYAVKYWIPFDAPLLGFHDSSWQTFPYGSAQYKTDGSHGCVHLPLAGMKFLYGWARVGATVDIRA